MHFELVPDDESGTRQQITFEGDEVEVVKAVFLEHQVYLARTGNLGSISDFDRALAKWEGKKPLPAKLINYQDFAEHFETFAERTEDALIEIANESLIPPFVNETIVQRYELGQRALQMSVTIKEEGAKIFEPIQPSEIPEPGSIDIDAAFSNLLGDNQESPPDK